MWIYDNNGAYIGFTYNGVEYYYVYNLQGDVEAITDSTGAIVAKYGYDTWGEVETTWSAAGTGNIAQINPIRYRGYYYDSERGLYYLNSRYYDPFMCRFLNADGYVSTGQGVTSFNMFAYCGNNPVNRADPTGQSWIVALIVTAVVVCATSLSGCSKRSSPPSNYVSNNSSNQNCYSYAFKLPQAANPGDYSVSEKNSDRMYENKNKYTTKEITKFIERDMKALNKSVRVVNSPSDKKANEYIVAMKTSSIIIPQIGAADYHFAVQLSDGTWADKPGSTPSRWNELDGTAITWDCGNIKDYYNTESVYFAVEK